MLLKKLMKKLTIKKNKINKFILYTNKFILDKDKVKILSIKYV
jgi:hypothetical protein